MNPFRHLLDEINEALDRRSAHDAADEAADNAADHQEHLHHLRAEVEGKLAEERPADEDPERRSQLIDTLQEAEDRLQAEHPRLAQAIQQALRSLADAGL